jgi:hypothetical protein
MKKKTIKKLEINRETLAKLDELELHPVAGGTSTPEHCTFSGYRTCNTCGMTCGTNYC